MLLQGVASGDKETNNSERTKEANELINASKYVFFNLLFFFVKNAP